MGLCCKKQDRLAFAPYGNDRAGRVQVNELQVGKLQVVKFQVG
jgi:hypothetical protein